MSSASQKLGHSGVIQVKEIVQGAGNCLRFHLSGWRGNWRLQWMNWVIILSKVNGGKELAGPWPSSKWVNLKESLLGSRRSGFYTSFLFPEECCQWNEWILWAKVGTEHIPNRGVYFLSQAKYLPLWQHSSSRWWQVCKILTTFLKHTTTHTTNYVHYLFRLLLRNTMSLSIPRVSLLFSTLFKNVPNYI